MQGKKLTFKNTSSVRNAFLNTGVVNNYTAPTKVANGKTAVRSSKVEQNYAKDPSLFNWDSKYSYANTFEEPNKAEQKDQNKHAAKAIRSYGNRWPNAFSMMEEHAHSSDERFKSYYVKVVALIEDKFGVLEEDVLEEFVEGLSSMNDLTKLLKNGKITKAEYDLRAEPIFEDWHLNTGLPKEGLISNYKAFSVLFFQKEKQDLEAETVKTRALRNLLASKRASNAKRLRSNKNTARRWHTVPAKGENRTVGAELLALAAKHANRPKNFTGVYNEVRN